MRLRPKLDGNQGEIVKALRQAGCFVQSLAAIGNGCPDLLVARCGVIKLMELKDPSQPPSKQRLTRDEALWMANCKCEVNIVKTVDEALAVMNL